MLQHVAVPVIENHVCESWHRRKGIDIRIYDEMMCAGYELGQRDACQVCILLWRLHEYRYHHHEYAELVRLRPCSSLQILSSLVMGMISWRAKLTFSSLSSSIPTTGRFWRTIDAQPIWSLVSGGHCLGWILLRQTISAGHLSSSKFRLGRRTVSRHHFLL